MRNKSVFSGNSIKKQIVKVSKSLKQERETFRYYFHFVMKYTQHLLVHRQTLKWHFSLIFSDDYRIWLCNENFCIEQRIGIQNEWKSGENLRRMKSTINVHEKWLIEINLLSEKHYFSFSFKTLIFCECFMIRNFIEISHRCLLIFRTELPNRETHSSLDTNFPSLEPFN